MASAPSMNMLDYPDDLQMLQASQTTLHHLILNATKNSPLPSETLLKNPKDLSFNVNIIIYGVLNQVGQL